MLESVGLTCRVNVCSKRHRSRHYVKCVIIQKNMNTEFMQGKDSFMIASGVFFL